jgi:hypothetical protein
MKCESLRLYRYGFVQVFVLKEKSEKVRKSKRGMR